MKKIAYKGHLTRSAHEAGKASTKADGYKYGVRFKVLEDGEEEPSEVEILYPDLEGLEDLSRTVAWFVFEEPKRLAAKKPKDKNYVPPTGPIFIE